ncbi:hypothetical protein SDC9_180209 [bioreactor metagenome]|uniref:Uncharacterized protein n=1 Tax=bioreactor metagenome TaxID=1076179 RepID=A0A645H400_9ZZZZ
MCGPIASLDGADSGGDNFRNRFGLFQGAFQVLQLRRIEAIGDPDGNFQGIRLFNCMFLTEGRGYFFVGGALGFHGLSSDFFSHGFCQREVNLTQHFGDLLPYIRRFHHLKLKDEGIPQVLLLHL